MIIMVTPFIITPQFGQHGCYMPFLMKALEPLQCTLLCTRLGYKWPSSFRPSTLGLISQGPIPDWSALGWIWANLGAICKPLHDGGPIILKVQNFGLFPPQLDG